MNPSSISSVSLSTSSCSKRKRDPNYAVDEPMKHDLFLNYSEDLGHNIISHVKGALHRNGFTTSDHNNLPVGQEMCSELLKAIQGCQIFVLVFSMNYASSVTCLDELVNIMNCFRKSRNKKKVLPVFYKVNPSDVRKQEGPFKEAFEAHTNNFDHHRIRKWRKALNDAGQLSGQHYKYGDEETFIRKIVKKLKTMQNPQQLYLPDHLVGIESRVQELISSLSLDLEDVSLIVAVLGISGIGKTTIAAATFNRIAAKFDASCFLGGIYYYDSGSQTSMVKLQKKLISGLSQNDKLPMIQNNLEGVSKIIKITSRRKVLLILDDVANFDQLKALGINPKFFQGGSRIIVTTRDKRSLGTLSYVSYNTSFLNEMESIELFTRLTYKQDEPIDTHLVNETAYHSSGLPLVLEVWSRHFTFHEKREQWRNVLETLKAIPLDDVQKKLQISYDSLTNRAKKLFLDIACFFNGMDMELILKVLQDEESAFFPDIVIQCLVDRCLVIISSDGILSMHDVIREMGQEIVRQENEDEPGQRTRLMNHKDVLRVLKDYSGTHSVESIYQRNMSAHIGAFRKMNNLRLIRLHDVALCSNPTNPLGCDCDGMSPLSFPKLKYLEWERFPMESINIDMCNVVVVKLEWSRLTTLWKRPKLLEKLKILDVSDSSSLAKTGNFIGLENLEYLCFKRCENLEELDNSVWCLDKLVKLDLSYCKRLKRFPALKMELGKVRSLQELDLSSCESIGFEDDEVIKHFMSSLKETHITSLILEHCKICKVPSEVGSLTSLKYLSLYENVDLRSLPDSLVQLDQLETIHLSYCSSLQSIPDLPRSICSVYADRCERLTTLPSNMVELTSLTKLDLSRCWCLTNLPSTMSELASLEELRLGGCSKLGIEDPECLMKLTGLTRLEILDMRDCNVSQVPREIGNLVSLNSLNLDGNTFCSLPDSFCNLLQLCDLSIFRCSKLISLPLLPPSLKTIEAEGCKSLDVMRSAYNSVVKDDHLCGCPTPAALNMTNYPYYNFSKCVLAAYREASFLSRLQIHLSYSDDDDDEEEKFPIWCHNVFGSNSQAEFMAAQHLDQRKICGIILCLRSGYGDVELQNKTKGTTCCLTKVDQGPFLHKMMCIMFYPLDNTTLMVEAGDTLAIHFQGRSSLGCGVCLIYKEGDEMEAVEPTTTPFNFNPIPNHVNSP